MKRVGTTQDGDIIVVIGKLELEVMSGYSDQLRDLANALTRALDLQEIKPDLSAAKVQESSAGKTFHKSVEKPTSTRNRTSAPASGRVCATCGKGLPQGSNRKTHPGKCTEDYQREYARKWYQKNRTAGGEGTAPREPHSLTIAGSTPAPASKCAACRTGPAEPGGKLCARCAKSAKKVQERVGHTTPGPEGDEA